MSDRAALLAAIRQFPDADTPRLMFADWLEEHGESEHAAFIRVMIERDRLEPFTDEWHDADDRLRPLWDRGTDADGFMVRPASWGAFDWSRGFIEVVRSITAANWLAHADAILAEHPVRRVRLTSVPGGIFSLSLPWAFITLQSRGVEVRVKALNNGQEPPMGPVDYLKRVWPGIEFELPSGTNAGGGE